MLELHDTTVAAIVQVGDQVVVFLRAYVHQSEVRPGVDAGSGWVQAVALTFAEGTVEGAIPDLPADIWHGDLVVDEVIMSNMVPLPFHLTGSVALQLQLDAPAEIIVRGRKMELTLIGEAVYVEEFWRAGTTLQE